MKRPTHEQLPPVPEPRPGDVVVVDVYGTPKSGVIDSTNICGDDKVFVVVRASAYRDGDVVSCSGGPCPCISKGDLIYKGTTTQWFWRWKDRPRAGGGEDYAMDVNLWGVNCD